MPKLRFDPLTYQFYYRCRAEERVGGNTAGFEWDPIRRRYYTENPYVAVALASGGDDYVVALLADVLGDAAVSGLPAGACQSPQWAAGISSGLNGVH